MCVHVYWYSSMIIFIDDAKHARALIGIVVISSSSMDDERGVIGFFNRDPSSRATALSLRTEKLCLNFLQWPPAPQQAKIAIVTPC